MFFEPGSRLDAYEIIGPLGSGGMGEVWLARDTSLGRKVALKLLPHDLTRDTLRVARFQQEARAASALSHPNVCHIYALGQASDGQHYIAMELVEGQTLRTRLHAERISIKDALHIATQMAAAGADSPATRASTRLRTLPGTTMPSSPAATTSSARKALPPDRSNTWPASSADGGAPSTPARSSASS